MLKSFLSLIQSLVWPLTLIVFFWVVLLFDEMYGLGFREWGIQPRQVKGLIGILTSPFLHGDAGHLFSNSVPFLVASGFLFYLFPEDKWKIFGLIWFFSGFGVWLYGGANSNHIGASGVVYGLVAFMLTGGIIRKNRTMAAFALILIFAYGSMVWGIFPQWHVDPFVNISWESHLAGTVTGLILAFRFRKHGPPDDSYFEDETDDDDDGDYHEWMDDPFYDQENIKKEDFTIRYHLKPKNDDETH
jgi:membrane associated rhomboid family serine protease